MKHTTLRLVVRGWTRAMPAAGLLALALLAAGCGGAAAPPEEEAAPAEEEATEEAPAEEQMAEEEELPAEVAFEGNTSVVGGEAVASGELTVESLGMGTVDATAPAEMQLGDEGTVHLEITPLYDPQDVEVETLVTVTAVEDPVEVLNFYDELRLYSIMSARLSAPGFAADSPSSETQRLISGTPAVWVWTVVAQQAGRRSITVSISVPIIIDGEVQEIETSPLRTIEFVVNVLGPPTETPTLTPVPTETPAPTETPVPTLTPLPTPTPSFIARTFEEVGPEVVAAIILGLLGTVGSFIWGRLRRDRSKK